MSGGYDRAGFRELQRNVRSALDCAARALVAMRSADFRYEPEICSSGFINEECVSDMTEVSLGQREEQMSWDKLKHAQSRLYEVELNKHRRMKEIAEHHMKNSSKKEI